MEKDNLEEEFKKLKSDYKKLDKFCIKQKYRIQRLEEENQALYESINCNDDTMLARLFEKQKTDNIRMANELKKKKDSANFLYKKIGRQRNQITNLLKGGK